MNEFQKIKEKVIEEADRWARKIARSDNELSKEEQALFDAVLEYNQAVKDQPQYVPKSKGIFIPPPPKMPNPNNFPSQIPTIPAGPIQIKRALKGENK